MAHGARSQYNVAMDVELGRLIDALPGLVWTTLPDGRAEFLNRRWREYTGLSCDAAIGFGWHSAIHPEDLARMLEYWRTFRHCGAPGKAAARLRRRDGEYRRFLFSAAPIADASGCVVRWCGFNTEIEDLLQSQEATREQELASIAHEINQPLAGILVNATTCLRMLAADPPNVEGARATAQRTLRDSERASEVVQRLRILFAHEQPQIEPVGLNDVARAALALMAGELQINQVGLQTEFADGLRDIRVDRVQLQQVILNLIVNAVDALKTVHDRSRHLHVGTSSEGANEVQLWVRDCGVGIDSEKVEKLFDAFYTTKSHGMGLGLSISRSIIHSYGGRLWATANDGPGSTFWFSIPVQRCR
jgi:PAS domain S-box-containing protein